MLYYVFSQYDDDKTLNSNALIDQSQASDEGALDHLA